MRRELFILVAVVALLVSGCVAVTPVPPAGSGAESKAAPATEPEKAAEVTLAVATVNNPDMIIMAELASEFTKETGINVKFVTLPDQQLRQQVTQDVALGTGTYDIVTIGPDEIQTTWAKNKWVVALDDFFANMDEAERAVYDLDDVIQPIRERLTIDGKLYGLPFYGESNFTYYRKDLFEEAGLTMPEEPTWDEIRQFAATLHNPDSGLYGIVLKGIAEYGQLAPFMTFVNSFGVRWFDMDWHPAVHVPGVQRSYQVLC